MTHQFRRLSRLDVAVWRIGERVPWWWRALAPVAVLLLGPHTVSTGVVALVLGWAAIIVTGTHSAVNRRLLDIVDRWTAAPPDRP